MQCRNPCQIREPPSRTAWRLGAPEPGDTVDFCPWNDSRTSSERADVVAVYTRYLARCNEHRFDELDDVVAEQVGGSGTVDGLAAYVHRLEVVHTAFPDYRWELQHLVAEHDTIAARLIGQGTHTGPFGDIAPTGRRIRTQELVMYRFEDGKIVQCWGDFFPVVRDALVTTTASARAEL